MENIIKQLIKDINTIRLNNKNKWYYYTNKDLGIELKAFDTWIQIFRVKGKNYPSVMELAVGEFKSHIKRVLTLELIEN